MNKYFFNQNNMKSLILRFKPVFKQIQFITLMLLLFSGYKLSATTMPTLDKRVLILIPGGMGANPAVDLFTKELTFSLIDGGVDVQKIYTEYLDITRNPGNEYLQQLASFLNNKYYNQSIDMVFCLFQPAINFLLKEGKNLAPGAVTLSWAPRVPNNLEVDDRQFFFQTYSLDVKGTMELALDMFPKTERVVAILGSGEIERTSGDALGRYISEGYENIHFETTQNLSIEEMKTKLSTLPENTIILGYSISRDNTGKTVTSVDVFKQLAKTSNAPIFAMFDIQIGIGTIGGSIIDIKGDATSLADKGVEILSGSLKLSGAVTIFKDSNTPMFDWQELKRWGVDPGVLPSNTVFINKLPTLWEQYRVTVILMIVTLIILCTMIFLLLYLNSRLKKANNNATNSEQKYRGIIRGSRDAIFRMDIPSGEYSLFSYAAREVFGYDSKVFLDNPLFIKEIIAPKWKDYFDEKWNDLFKGDVPETYEYQIVDNDGKLRWIHQLNTAVWDNDKKIIAMEGSCRNITENKNAEEALKQSEEQLHQSQKMDAIGQLAGGIAHDFNNSLAGIIGATEMVLSGQCDVKKQKRYLDMILTSAERAGELTKKLLFFSRKGHKLSSAVDMIGIVNETADLLEHTIDKNISISIVNNSTNWMIIGDDSMLQNAIMNLAINSSHAMLEGGEIVFTLGNITLDSEYCKVSPFEIKPGEYLQVDIRDSGTGMNHEIQSHIFEPFFTTKEQGQGTGIGLATVYGAVKDHNGAIDVNSEEGTGTVFHLFFPITADKLNNTKQREIITGSGTILVIDDEELIRVTSKAMLISLGYKVLCAENGEIGVQMFSEYCNDIDLVILDMIMPVMGGREAFNRLRKIDNNIPIIISSGFAKDSDLEVLKKQEVYGLLHKPFRRVVLAEVVAGILDSTDHD